MMRECRCTHQEEWILMVDDCLIFLGGIFKGRNLTDGDHGGRLGRLHAHHPQLASHHVNRHSPMHILDHLAYKQGRPHHLSWGCSTGTLQGLGMMGILSLSLAWERPTCSNKGSETGLPKVFISQMGSSGSKSSTGSKPPFRPSGHTT